MRYQAIPIGGTLPDDADDKLREFLDYWRSKCPVGGLPRRHDIDPIEIVPLLSSMLLFDVEAQDFRFSLIGEEIGDRYGSLKGKSLREVMTGLELEETLDEHRLCVTARVPVYSRNHQRLDGDWQLFQRLLTPLVSDGDAVTCLAGIVIFRSTGD